MEIDKENVIKPNEEPSKITEQSILLIKPNDDQTNDLVGQKQQQKVEKKQGDNQESNGTEESGPTSSPTMEEPPKPTNLLGQTHFAQIEDYLALQVDRCSGRRTYFESQGDLVMASKFGSLAKLTSKDLNLLRTVWRARGQLPEYTFDVIKLNCVPINYDVEEKRVNVVIRTLNLPHPPDSQIYAAAEFNFKNPNVPTVAESCSKWLHNVRTRFKLFECCKKESKEVQYDVVSAVETKPFYDPQSNLVEYERPISFYINRAKSKNFKRKYSPIKIDFFEKNNIFSSDKKLGSVHVNIDVINDKATVNLRLPILLVQKDTGAQADITVKVREAFVEKEITEHEEKILRFV